MKRLVKKTFAIGIGVGELTHQAGLNQVAMEFFLGAPRRAMPFRDLLSLLGSRPVLRTKTRLPLEVS
jgi:hypothetical protein